MVRDLIVENGEIKFTLMLTTPACPLKDKMKTESEQAVMSIPGVKSVQIQFSAEVKANKPLGSNAQMPVGIKNIIAVASGKGGVGKKQSTVCQFGGEPSALGRQGWAFRCRYLWTERSHDDGHSGE